MGEAKPHPNNRAAARGIVAVLREAGHVAYFAGGCVRDELLGLNPQDYDVATDATPDQVASLFHNTRAVGRAFGVMIVRLKGTTCEVATFREDAGYSDSRRPDSVRFADAQADALRRDFTINALFLDPLHPSHDRAVSGGTPRIRGKVIDFVGGLEDLKRGVIRAVGDPAQRLHEDHLRALRGVRFAARLAFNIEPATAAAIAEHAGQLKGVSRERVGDELRRMFAQPSRGRAAQWLQRLRLDGPSLDEPALGDIPLTRTEALPLDGSAEDRGISPSIAGLTAWAVDRLDHQNLHANAPPDEWHAATGRLVRGWRAALCLTNDERQALRSTLDGIALLRHTWLDLAVAGQKRAAGSPWFMPALAIVGIENPERAGTIAARVSELARTPSGIAPPPLITGYDLIDAGHTPSPAFARCLETVYDAQLEDRIATQQQAMELAERLLSA